MISNIVSHLELTVQKNKVAINVLKKDHCTGGGGADFHHDKNNHK
jgi:hypothetical protein